MMPVISTKWNCGCVAKTSATHNRVYIEYCSMHAAADKLHEALTNLVRDHLVRMRENPGDNVYVDEGLAVLKEATGR